MFVVTGANGFIGSAMVWQLNQLGIENILVSDYEKSSENKRPLYNYRFRRYVDASELFEAMMQLSHEQKIQAVFHMGACSSTTEINKVYLNEVNTDYTKKMFSFCQKNSIPLIYASSAATYGNGENGFDDCKPSNTYSAMNMYGQSKLDVDIWLESKKEFPSFTYGLRFFNVYGPNEYHKENMRSLVNKSYYQIKETQIMTLFKSHRPEYEDGKQMRDFVYIKDVTSWMWELFENREKVKPGVYNMGFGRARSWLDLSKNVFLSLGLPEKINWIDIPDNIRNQYQYFTEAEMSKWYSQGLSHAKWTLEKGINDYVRNYLVNDLFL